MSPQHKAPAQVPKPQTFAQTHIGVQLLTAGSAACFADFMTFPLDTVKVRQQIQSNIKYFQCSPGSSGMCHMVTQRGVLGTLANVARYEGGRALYCGIVPGLQRQMVMTGLRLGLYERVREKYRSLLGVEAGLGWGMIGARILAGFTTGSVAICVAQPMDVVKIRMQAAGVGGRYNGVIDAYRRVARTEGLSQGLYRGLGPNIARNGIVNVCEIVVYDVAKEAILTTGIMADGVLCHFSSAIMAGFTAAAVANPVDLVKTRYMNSPRGEYRNVIHCAVKTAKQEGFKAFYKGFAPSCLRIVSYNIMLWITFEQLKKVVNTFYARDQD